MREMLIPCERGCLLGSTVARGPACCSHSSRVYAHRSPVYLQCDRLGIRRFVSSGTSAVEYIPAPACGCLSFLIFLEAHLHSMRRGYQLGLTQDHANERRQLPLQLLARCSLTASKCRRGERKGETADVAQSRRSGATRALSPIPKIRRVWYDVRVARLGVAPPHKQRPVALHALVLVPSPDVALQVFVFVHHPHILS